MAQISIQRAFDLAVQYHQSGRLNEAEQLYRQILLHAPEHAGILHCNIGNVLRDQNRPDEAIVAYRQALMLIPNLPEAHYNLGSAYKETAHLNEAIAAYRQAIMLRPDFPDAHYNLGNALQATGNHDEAITAYRRALILMPDFPDAHYNLGNALHSQGCLDEAIVAYRQAIVLSPAFPEAHNNLGDALKDKGCLDEAAVAYRQAIAIKPEFSEAINNLGNVLQEKGRVDEAIAAYHQAITCRPDFPEAYNNLGKALKARGGLDEAIAACNQALAIKPDFPEALNNLGNYLKDKGDMAEAIAAYRRALAIKPDCPGTHSNLVFSLLYFAGMDASAIAREQQCWNQQHAKPLHQFIRPHDNDRNPDRRLRIGYVSPDLRDHVVGRNLIPLLTNHDKNGFEIFAYAQVTVPDARTEQFRACTDHWQSIVGWSDEKVANHIRQDGIDILVDLSLHTANNRLLVFARKPSPIQVTFAGYPGSTGLTTIDYRLSDPYLDPPGMDESVYSEQTIRLPGSFWCYDPLENRDLPVNSLPALQTGVVTFGCLNNFCKINQSVLAVWAQVLRKVTNSRLLLLAPNGEHRQRMIQRLSAEGIDPARVEFVPPQPRRGYLELYHRIDLSLDSFPYNGHTTSLDSFWMGVPVVTLVGNTVVSRAGWCQLSNLGLSKLAAQNRDEFVQITVDLASDLPRLGELRMTLRQQMEASPLMDAHGFARSIEAAYRLMWRKCCKESVALSSSSLLRRR